MDFCARAFCVNLWAYYGLIWLYVGFTCVVPTGNFTSHSRGAHHDVEKTRGSKTKRARQDDDRETRRWTRRREEIGREKDTRQGERIELQKKKKKKKGEKKKVTWREETGREKDEPGKRNELQKKEKKTWRKDTRQEETGREKTSPGERNEFKKG